MSKTIFTKAEQPENGRKIEVSSPRTDWEPFFYSNGQLTDPNGWYDTFHWDRFDDRILWRYYQPKTKDPEIQRLEYHLRQAQNDVNTLKQKQK